MIDPNQFAEPAWSVQRSLLENEIAMWINTRYMARVRLRVQTAIGGEAETRAALIADLEKCEKALDALSADLAALPDEGRPA
jgi:hypothetical protein